MVRIGLLSDTHGFFPEDALKYFENVDEIWHAGDIGSHEVIDKLEAFKPCRIVFGNIDDTSIQQRTKEDQVFEIEQLSVFMTHIAGKPKKYQRGVDKKIKLLQPQLVVCGHSHLPLVAYDHALQTLWMNPGAAGMHGFHQERTILRFAINKGKIEQVELIELGKRGTIHNEVQ